MRLSLRYRPYEPHHFWQGESGCQKVRLPCDTAEGAVVVGMRGMMVVVVPIMLLGGLIFQAEVLVMAMIV